MRSRTLPQKRSRTQVGPSVGGIIHGFLLSGVLLALLSATPRPIMAQQAAPGNTTDPLVKLTSAEYATFEGALEALGSRSHITFVAEGTPIRPSLPEKDLPVLPPSLPISSAVEKVASAYDYDFSRTGNLFILQKRYTDSQDLPALTMDECVQFLQSITRLGEPFNPHIVMKHWHKDKPLPRDEVVGDLAASLTPAQLAAMDSGTLHVTDLEKAQQEMVRTFVLYNYVQMQRMDMVGKGLSRLEQADEQVVFHWGNYGTLQHIFGYDVPEGPLKLPFFWPLSLPFFNQSSLSGPAFYTGSMTAPPKDADPTDPLPATDGEVAPSTLHSVVASLNARPESHVRLSVDEALGRKPVTLVGAENSTPVEIAQALADVYGLRVAMENGGRSLRLTLPRPVPAPVDVAALPEALRSSIPLPLFHALHLREYIELERRMRDYNQLSYRLPRSPGGSKTPQGGTKTGADGDESLAELSEAMRERKTRVYAGDRLEHYSDLNFDWMRGEPPMKLRIAAIRWLRTLVQPRVQNAPNGSVAFRELSDQGRNAFATMLTLDCLRWVAPVLGDDVAPEWVVHFDKGRLSGGIHTEHDGTQRFVMSLRFSDPGRKDDYPGIVTSTHFVK